MIPNLLDSRLPDRFWDKVSPEPNSGCWLWTAQLSQASGGRREGGYGRFSPVWNKPPGYAHRLAYEALVGPIANGFQLDHLCRQRCCVNPSHLEPVTSHENTLRGDSARTHRDRMSAMTHCKHGHAFTADNLLDVPANGTAKRRCRECARIRSDRGNKRRKALGIKRAPVARRTS